MIAGAMAIILTELTIVLVLFGFGMPSYNIRPDIVIIIWLGYTFLTLAVMQINFNRSYNAYKKKIYKKEDE